MTDKPSAAEAAPGAKAAPGANLPELSVSELSAALKRTVEGAFSRVRVRGEISGFTRAASGHLYLSLKDENAVLDGVCWRGTAGRLSIRPEDGMEVVATGRLSTYAQRSRYQIIIETMELAGEGALLKLLEERRQKLLAEGLFDEDRKQPLPFLPEVIGVVTSPTGAVIRDILHRLADRFPRRVLLWPVLVQGDGAAGQVADAIDGFNRLDAGGAVPRPDLLIVARGGGSLEDLWAFNEETVVRAAAASGIPLISAVGHETDTTLIDFAADLRAPTPTAAAEMAVPVRADLLARVGEDGTRLMRAAERRLEDGRMRLQGLARGLPEPRRLTEEAAQRLDDRVARLAQAGLTRIRALDQRIRALAVGLIRPDRQIAAKGELLAARLDAWRRGLGAFLAGRNAALAQPSTRLGALPMGERLGAAAARLGDLEKRLDRTANRAIEDTARRLGEVGTLLDGLSYTRVLERGFALVTDGGGAAVTSTGQAPAGTDVTIRFHDGSVAARIKAATPAKARTKKKPPGDDDPQGSLL